jgi:hypothetical protein
MSTEPYVVEVVKSSEHITQYVFRQPNKEKQIEDSKREQLAELAKSDAPFKYICMGRNDDYHELSNTILRPFGTMADAVLYGKEILKYKSFGEYYYQSFVIQPLLLGKNSFEMTEEQIDFVLALEKVDA